MQDRAQPVGEPVGILDEPDVVAGERRGLEAQRGGEHGRGELALLAAGLLPDADTTRVGPLRRAARSGRQRVVGRSSWANQKRSSAAACGSRSPPKLPGPEECWLLDADGNRYTTELRLTAVDLTRRPS